MSKSSSIFVLTMMLFLSFYTKNSIAQLDTFNPGSYKVPDFRYRLLDLSFDISGNMQKSNGSTVDQLSNDFRPQFTLSYSKHHNSREKQVFSQYAFNSSSYWNNAKNTQNTTENSQNTLSLDFYGSVKEETKYFYANNFFIGYKMNAQFQLQINNNTSQIIENSTVNQKFKNNQDNSQSDLGIAFAIGKGRIEETRYAMTAYYILKDLYAKKLLQQEPTHAQVLELAEEIGKIINRRTFDLRDKTIEELTQLDSTLSTLQILPDKNIKYFTVLTDNWLFANLPSRRSGLSYEANITANLFSNAAFTQQTELLYDTIASRFNDNTIGAGTGFIFSLTYEKPISIKWQQSANAYIAPKFTYQGNKLENLIGTTSTDAQIPSMELGGSYTLGYYPNTRTYLTIGLDEFAKLYQLKQESSSTSYLIYNSQARANLYYFFSPTLRLQAQLGLLFSHYRQNPETNGNTTKISNTWLNLGATLVYSVF